MKKSENGKSKYFLEIEGTIHDWDQDTITTEEIIELGGWESSQGVILIDLKTNEEETLSPGQIVELRPGLGFSKKHKFKRG